MNQFQSSPFFYLQHLVSDFVQHLASDFVQVLVTSVFAFVQHPDVVVDFVAVHPKRRKNTEIAIKCFILVFLFYMWFPLKVFK